MVPEQLFLQLIVRLISLLRLSLLKKEQTMNMKQIGVFAITFASLLSSAVEVKTGVQDFFPLGDSKTNAQYPGIFYEALEKIVVNAGHEANMQVLPIPRLNNGADVGSVDVKMGLKTNGVNNAVQLGCHSTIVVQKDGVNITHVDQLNGKRIGFVNNGIFQRLYSKKFGTVNEFVNNDESLFRMTINGRIDGFFISHIVLDSYKRFGIPHARLDMNWQDEMGEPLLISTSPVYFQVSSKSQLSFNTVNELIASAQQLVDQGDIAQIYKQYGIDNGGACD